MLKTILDWWAALDDFILRPTPTRAVVFGLLLSWGLTHGTRFYTIRKLDTATAKNLEEVVSFLVCAVTCLCLWPTPHSVISLFASAITALWSPFAYTRVAALVARYIPFLDPTPKAPTPITVTAPAPLDKQQSRQ